MCFGLYATRQLKSWNDVELLSSASGWVDKRKVAAEAIGVGIQGLSPMEALQED